MSVSVILLSGGSGTRFGGEIPKQYMLLKKKRVILYSLEVFLSSKEIGEIIIVADKQWRKKLNHPRVIFADPGKRRQDSLFNGLLKATKPYICVHDAARPNISLPMLHKLFEEGKKHGAATLACPVPYTIKEGDEKEFVVRTLKREQLWAIQTPQFVTKTLLVEGFKKAFEHNLDVTDDVSLAELLSHPVKLVKSEPGNIKVTYPEDLIFLKSLL